MCCVLWPVFTRGQTHSTDTAQHRDTQHSQIIVIFFNVVVPSMIHDNMYVYFPFFLKCFERGHKCEDPRDGERSLRRAKSGEFPVEARSDIDAQIVR